MNPRTTLTALATAVMFAASAAAGPFEDAGAAHARGDYATEYKLLAPLGAAGDPDSQFNLGVLYQKGLGVTQNNAVALKWYRKAAAQGNGLAKLSLGVMYANGDGVKKDFLQARVWFNLAVAAIPESDAAHHANAVAYRDRVAANLTPAQIAEAQRRARKMQPK
jgi:hypothetical protein